MKTPEQLVVECQGLVRSLAWQIHCKLPATVDLDDLVGYGQIGLLEAARSFDPTREIQFTTYSYHRIRGAIFDGLAKMSWFNQASFNGGAYERQRQAPKPAPVATQPSRESLIANMQTLVRTLAWQIQRKLPAEVDLSELVRYGQNGLNKAADDFVQKPNTQFSTFCYRYIQESIFQGLSRKSWFSLADFHRGAYEVQAGPLPEPESETDVAPVTESATATESRSTDSGAWGLATVICHQLADGDASGVEQKSARPQTPDDLVIQREMVEKLHELIDDLPEPAKTLIRSAYFEGMTLKDAAQQLGMSKAWASRLHSKTLERLAKSFRQSRMSE